MLNEMKEDGEVAKITTKLMKERADVEFNPRQEDLDLLFLDEQDCLSRLEAVVDEVSKGELDKSLAEVRAKQVELAKVSVKAVMVPLKYRDIRTVQTAVTEAIISTETMGFDYTTRLIMVSQEKKLMTIFLSLKKSSGSLEPYFASLHEIVVVSQKTIDDLYERYCQEFELTDKEIKN
jgi:hypothetical protein